MGLRYGFDEKEGKWYASGLWFVKYYDSEEAMNNDKSNALDEYFDRLDVFQAFAMGLASLR